MKEIILKRYYHNDCTLGKMKFTIKPKSNSRIKEDRAITIYTLELPYRDNQKNISCIPEGEYILRPHKSGTLGKCFKVYSLDENDKDNIPITGDTLYKLKEVPNRSGILIHRGCELKDTRGCILIGKRFFIETANEEEINKREINKGENKQENKREKEKIFLYRNSDALADLNEFFDRERLNYCKLIITSQKKETKEKEDKTENNKTEEEEKENKTELKGEIN